MAAPRVFVSSTYYDLKYVRSSLELFIDSLGYDAVLSETGGIAYTPDQPLDESCYREVQTCDLYVLIVGGRYGSEASKSKVEGNGKHDFFAPYESVTKLEYRAAVDKDIPIYIMIEKSVNAEYQTYKKNRDNTSISYAHVDSVNVFRFIDEILAQGRNNVVHSFDRYAEIEDWLRAQWAGVFRDHLQRRSSQQQLASLAAQVAALSEVNTTLKSYLEQVLKSVSSDNAAKIIKSEQERLEIATKLNQLDGIGYIEYLRRRGYPLSIIVQSLEESSNVDDFIDRVNSLLSTDASHNIRGFALRIAQTSRIALYDLNQARELLGLSPFDSPKSEIEALDQQSQTDQKKPRHSSLTTKQKQSTPSPDKPKENSKA